MWFSSFDLGHPGDDHACKCSQSRRGGRGCVITNNGDTHDATSSDGGCQWRRQYTWLTIPEDWIAGASFATAAEAGAA